MEGFSFEAFEAIGTPEIINSIWEGGFLDYDVNDINQEIIDSLHDNFYWTDSLRKLRDELVSAVVKLSPERCASLWSSVAADEGLGKKIMATLAYFMDSSKQRNAEVHVYMKEASILAAGVYMTMLRLPGHSCIQLFHPVLFQKSIDVLKQLQAIDCKLSQDKKARPSKSGSSQGSRTSQISRRKKLSTQTKQTSFEDTCDELELSDHDLLRLRQHLVALLQSLVSFLKVNPLKNESHLSESVVSLLANLTTVEPNSFSTSFNSNIVPSNITSVGHLAYVGILTICMRNTGTSVAMVKQAFSSLEHNLLMFVGQKKDRVAAQNIPREIIMIRDQTMAFVLHLMNEGKNNVMQPVLRLIKSVILSTPDRSEYRVKIAQMVMAVMGEMDVSTYCDMCKWLYQLSKYKKGSGRMMSVEIYGQLLMSKGLRNLSGECVDEELQHYTTRSVLLQALLTRCSDRVPSVAAKALSTLALSLNCVDPVVKDKIRSFLAPRPSSRVLRLHRNEDRTSNFSEEGRSSALVSIATRSDTDGVSSTPTGSATDIRSASNFTRYGCRGSSATFYLTRGFDITLADSDGLTSMVARRIKSNKAVVRKSALLALESIIMYNECLNMGKELDIMRDHCRDVAVPIRKQAIQSLTQLLQLYPDDKDVQLAWLTGVLPAHDDNEASVQEKCWQSVKLVILENLNQSAASSALAWSLCTKMNTEELSSLKTMLCSICVQLHKTSSLPVNIIQHLSGHITSNHSKEAWMLLSMVCPIVSTHGSKTSDIVAAQWLDNCSNMEQSVSIYVLITIATLAQHMSSSNRTKLVHDLTNRLRTYRVPLSSIKYMVVALAQLKESDGAHWVKEIVKEIDTFLYDIVYGDTYDQQALAIMPNYLITLGEISLHNPNALSDRLIQIVQCLLLVPKVQVEKRKPGFISDMIDGLLPASLKLHAIHCMGQICLQRELLAKQTIPILARELELSPDPAVKKTVVTILCDLCKLIHIPPQKTLNELPHSLTRLMHQKQCTLSADLIVNIINSVGQVHYISITGTQHLHYRYTNSVGPYVSSISTCLKDSSAEVSKSTFIGLTRLLQEDFLKWKGSLFYRFISCVVSDNADVAQLARVTFIHELSKRHKGMFTQHFVECLYHFNDFTGHKSYNRFPQTDSERKLFSLAGKENFDKRHSIYNFMLEDMTDTQKFTTMERLCQDIIADAVEKKLPSNSEQGAAVLTDALSILQSKKIKLSVTKASTEALIDGSEEITPSLATNAKAVTAEVTKLLKKNFVEMVIPDIISLKLLLEAEHSPIIKHLMLFLIEITKDYKAELADILAGNEQLAAELDFDIKRFEEMERAAAETANAVLPGSTPGAVEGAVEAAPVQPSTTPLVPTTPAGAQANISIQQVTPQVSGTPQPRTFGRTPAMPPPPLRSALKKTMTATKHLLNSARKLAKEREESGGSSKTMRKKVNFDEEEENEALEQDENFIAGVPSTPLHPIISAAVGTRAISTPDGNLADLTFAANMSMVHRSLSPIVLVNNLSDQNSGTMLTRTSKHRSTGSTDKLPGDALTARWNLKSPKQHKERNKKCRPPLPTEDNVGERESAPNDTLDLIPLPPKSSRSQRRRSNRKRK